MAIFTGENKFSNGSANQNSTGATIIAQGTNFKGNITLECRLHIDGIIEGNISSKNTVIVGQSGSVVGDICAHTLIVNGSVNGKVTSPTIEVKAGGRLEGSVSASELIIEKKGVFLGETKINETKEIKEAKETKESKTKNTESKTTK